MRKNVFSIGLLSLAALTLLVVGCSGGGSSADLDTNVDPTTLTAATFEKSTAEVNDANISATGDEYAMALAGTGSVGGYGIPTKVKPVPKPFTKAFDHPVLKAAWQRALVTAGFMGEKQFNELNPNWQAKLVSFETIPANDQCTTGTASVDVDDLQNPSAITATFDDCALDGGTNTIDGAMTIDISYEGLELDAQGNPEQPPQAGETVSFEVTTTLENLKVTEGTDEYTGNTGSSDGITFGAELVVSDDGTTATGTMGLEVTEYSSDHETVATKTASFALAAETMDTYLGSMLFAISTRDFGYDATDGSVDCSSGNAIGTGVFQISEGSYVVGPTLPETTIALLADLNDDCEPGDGGQLALSYTGAAGSYDEYLVFMVDDNGALKILDGDGNELTCAVTGTGSSCVLDCGQASGTAFDCSLWATF